MIFMCKSNRYIHTYILIYNICTVPYGSVMVCHGFGQNDLNYSIHPYYICIPSACFLSLGALERHWSPLQRPSCHSHAIWAVEPRLVFHDVGWTEPSRNHSNGARRTAGKPLS